MEVAIRLILSNNLLCNWLQASWARSTKHYLAQSVVLVGWLNNNKEYGFVGVIAVMRGPVSHSHLCFCCHKKP